MSREGAPLSRPLAGWAVDPAAIARRLASATRWPGTLSEVGERTWRLLAATPQFDAWMIAWPHGGRVSLHDHGASRGALAVVCGTLAETVPWRDDAGRLSLLRHDLVAGSLRSLELGHIHDVTNPGTQTAVSLHVYSPPLTSMTHYDIADGRRLEARAVRSARHWSRGSAACAAGNADRHDLCLAG